MTIKDQINQLFSVANEWTVYELTDKTGASKQMVHIVLKQLVQAGFLIKLGRTPKTLYKIATTNFLLEEPKEQFGFSNPESNYLFDQWLQVTALGQLLEGEAAFRYWCNQRKEPIAKTFKEYQKTKEKYNTYIHKDGTIDGMDKLKNTKGYSEIWLDNLYYLDFYAIERFGKTKLGSLLHYAKQGQNLFLMQKLLTNISTRIENFIQTHQVDAVGFIPPTVRREVQLMKVMQQGLKLSLPIIDLKKINGLIPVPQKSLQKLSERIENASSSFLVGERRTFEHVLLIDDAVGSGATLNQVAEKIKVKQLTKKITGLAIVGSFKGFDVITDV